MEVWKLGRHDMLVILPRNTWVYFLFSAQGPYIPWYPVFLVIRRRSAIKKTQTQHNHALLVKNQPSVRSTTRTYINYISEDPKQQP